MTDDLPTEFDLIVVGTGFTESIVAAAASRVNKTVLHIDPNDFYGCQWASFNLENIQSFVDSINSVADSDATDNKGIENGTLQLENETNAIINDARYEWFANNEPIPATEETSEQPSNDTENTVEGSETVQEEKVPEKIADVWTKEKVLKEFRKFNIDLIPKLLFARGDLVELLISSNICRYGEFRAVDRVITTFHDGSVKAVPCSRSDVFTSKDVTVVEKRLLMKLLSNCMSFEPGCEEFKEFEQSTFRNYLESKKLTPKLIHHILYAISMSEDQTPCIEGVQRTKKFLSSLGRYGNTPFLFPMYGCGEIPQCFCRLSAVFGGIYCLKRPLTELHFSPSDNAGEDQTSGQQFKSIKCGEQVISGKHIVFGNGFKLPDKVLLDSKAKKDNCHRCGALARAIYITDKPIGEELLNSGGGGVNFLKLPTVSPNGETDQGAFVIQLSHFSGTCPKGLYLIHITTKKGVSDLCTSQSCIEPYEELIFNPDLKSSILWSLYFSIPNCLKCDKHDVTLPHNLFVSCGPYFELDYDQSIKQAKEIFVKIYSDEEFLPRAPDPEEIVIEGVEYDTGDNIVSDTDACEDILEEKIDAVVAEGIENEVKCIEENEQNENIDGLKSN